MTKRTLLLRIIMALVLFALLLAGARVDSVAVSGSEDSFIIVNLGYPSSHRRPGRIQTSIARTLPQGEPEILVTAQGAFESHIDAPDG